MIAAVAYNEIRPQPLPGSRLLRRPNDRCPLGFLVCHIQTQRGARGASYRNRANVHHNVISDQFPKCLDATARMLKASSMSSPGQWALMAISEKAGWNRCHGLALSLAIAPSSQIVKQLICDQRDVFNLGTVCSVPPPRCGPQIHVLRLSVRRVPPQSSVSLCCHYFPLPVPSGAP
jgi:hypothetical protein